jgi:hypothetical protein
VAGDDSALQGVAPGGPRSPWRFLVLPLVPVVAVWDAARAALRAWGEFGMRMLEKLDPLFARFTGWAVRIGERLRPLLERVAARAERLTARMRPALDRVTRAVRMIVEPIERAVAAVAAWLEPVRIALRHAGRLLGTPFRIVGRWIGRGAGAVRRWCAGTWSAAQAWVRSGLSVRGRGL